MTVWTWKKRRIVQRDAHGDRRVYWTVDVAVLRSVVFGVVWYSFAKDVGRIGRSDTVHLLFAMVEVRIERRADPL